MTTGNNRSSLVPVQPHIEQKDTKLGLIGLTAIVIGEVIGGGIFNIPKILGEGASLEAILIGWMISTTGILSIALTFKTLNSARSDLSDGIYILVPGSVIMRNSTALGDIGWEQRWEMSCSRSC